MSSGSVSTSRPSPPGNSGGKTTSNVAAVSGRPPRRPARRARRPRDDLEQVARGTSSGPRSCSPGTCDAPRRAANSSRASGLTVPSRDAPARRPAAASPARSRFDRRRADPPVAVGSRPGHRDELVRTVFGDQDLRLQPHSSTERFRSASMRAAARVRATSSRWAASVSGPPQRRGRRPAARAGGRPRGPARRGRPAASRSAARGCSDWSSTTSARRVATRAHASADA